MCKSGKTIKTLLFLMNESDSSNGMTKQEALNKIRGLKTVLPAASNEIDEIINVLAINKIFYIKILNFV